MSHDWLVATRTRPPPTALDMFAASAGIDLTVAGAFRPGASALVTRTNGTTARTIDVDGPDRAEPEDLPDDLAVVVTKPAWLVAVHLPGGFTGQRRRLDARPRDLPRPDGRRRGIRSADRPPDLADRRDATRPRPGIRADTDARPGLGHPGEPAPGGRGRSVAGPGGEAVPRRHARSFGEYEPFQGRLDRDGSAAFVQAWQAAAAAELGGMLFWTAARPGFDGSMGFPDSAPGSTSGTPSAVSAALLCAIDARRAPPRSCHRRRRRWPSSGKWRAPSSAAFATGFRGARRAPRARPVVVGPCLREQPHGLGAGGGSGLPAIPDLAGLVRGAVPRPRREARSRGWRRPDRTGSSSAPERFRWIATSSMESFEPRAGSPSRRPGEPVRPSIRRRGSRSWSDHRPSPAEVIPWID